MEIIGFALLHAVHAVLLGCILLTEVNNWWATVPVLVLLFAFVKSGKPTPASEEE